MEMWKLNKAYDNSSILLTKTQANIINQPINIIDDSLSEVIHAYCHETLCGGTGGGSSDNAAGGNGGNGGIGCGGGGGGAGTTGGRGGNGGSGLAVIISW